MSIRSAISNFFSRSFEFGGASFSAKGNSLTTLRKLQEITGVSSEGAVLKDGMNFYLRSVEFQHFGGTVVLRAADGTETEVVCFIKDNEVSREFFEGGEQETD